MKAFIDSLPPWAFYLGAVLAALALVALVGWGAAIGYRKYIGKLPEE